VRAIDERFAGLSPAWIDRLQRDRDRLVAARTLGGTVMAPLVMVLYTVVTGSGQRFSRPALVLTLVGLALWVPRLLITLKARKLPDSAPAVPWQRAFLAVTLVPTVVFGVYVGLGIYLLGIGVAATMLLFAAIAILSSSINIFSPNKMLMRAMIGLLYVLPLLGTLALDSNLKYVMAFLTTIQAVYTWSMGRRLEAEYWQFAVARAQLAQRNSDMRLVLDNVNQGFLTIDASGHLASERSAIIDRWFGEYVPPASFAAYIGVTDARFAENFVLAHETLTEGILPREVALDQLPARLQSGDRHYRCTYLELPQKDAREGGFLIVINDVTEELRRAQEDIAQKELLAVAQGLMTDRTGYLAFYEEGRDLVGQLVTPGIDRTSCQRLLHTLKGNAAMVGANALAAECHQAETVLEESDDDVPAATLALVEDRWKAIATTIDMLSGARPEGTVDVTTAAIDDVVARLRAGAPADEVATYVDTWKLEPAERSLVRLAHYAEPLAKRLLKGELLTTVSAERVRLDPAYWSGLWSVLVHVVRNAVDHGIEDPSERAAAGKPERPRLRLDATEHDGTLTIAIGDDGRGIDWACVRAKAATRGMRAETHDDLVRALLDAGFTTRDEVTTLSGRGIGMAAVRAEVEKLHGTIGVESTRGQGTTWRFTFPVPTAAAATSERRAA
jgi:HPt (histidine-containing phosphotransfer) domain-containing protein/two-component sensor histidine kinase